MVNFGLNSASILGIFLAVAGASLYFMRSVRPELARDHDIFFAAVGLLCGFILLFQGWRLDPILQFGQFLLTGSAIFFAVESIRLRAVATEQARRNTPIVDRDRPVSRTRVYTEAELDKIDPYEDYEGTPNYDSPRLRGYDDPQPRSSRRSSERRRPSTPTSDVRDTPRSRSRSEGYSEPYEREPRPSRRPSPPPVDDWREQDEWENPQTPSPRSRSRDNYRGDGYSETTSRPTSRRRPSAADLGRSYGTDYEEENNSSFNSDYDAGLGRSYDDEEEVINTDYVDYQPFDDEPDGYGDEEQDRGRPSKRDRDYDEEDNSQRRNPIDFDY
ncbi:MAG: Ycf66 family protein [Pleurocapsa sp.]